MIDRSTEIFQKVKTAVAEVCTNVGQSSLEIPTKFPYLSVAMTDNPVTGWDLENSECVVTPVFEITSYSKEGLTPAKEVLAIADAAMLGMYFQRILGPQEAENTADETVTRVFAQYRRTIADGDEF